MTKSKTDGTTDTAPTLHADSLVWDMTVPFTPGYDDIDQLIRCHEAGGTDFVSLTVNDFDDPLASTVRHIAKVRRMIAARADAMVFVTTTEAIARARSNGLLAVGFHFQETSPLLVSIDLVQVYYDLGVRHMLMAYNKKNFVGDGCAERTDAGLSRFGLSVVREMNRVGMIVDGSHSGYRTSMDAIETTSQPFIFSHSNAHAIHPHYRNIRDDQIKACAATGGVIGINGIGCFLGDVDASAEAMFRHIDHMVNLVGPDHVGIGLDYVYDPNWTWDNRDADEWPETDALVDGVDAPPERLPELTTTMLAHGYRKTDIAKILGGNFLRVASAVW